MAVAVVQKWILLAIGIVRFFSPRASVFVLAMVVTVETRKRQSVKVNAMGRGIVLAKWATSFNMWPGIGVCIFGFLRQTLTSWFLTANRLVGTVRGVFHPCRL